MLCEYFVILSRPALLLNYSRRRSTANGSAKFRILEAPPESSPEERRPGGRGVFVAFRCYASAGHVARLCSHHDVTDIDL